MKNLKILEKQLYILGWFFLLIIGFGVWTYFEIVLPYMPNCIFYVITDFYCFGCGGTRALQALLEGKFLHSLWYHPLILYTVVIFGGFMVTHTLEILHISSIKGWKYHNWYLYNALVIIIINVILKNILKFYFHITLETPIF